MVLVAGCMGGTTEKTTSGEETGAVSETQKETPQTSTVQESSEGTEQGETTPQPQEVVTDMDKIGSRSHVDLLDFNGVKGIKVYVEGSTWVSDGNAYNTRFTYAPMFYSGGNLYVYQYADESFSYAYQDGNLKVYPFVVIAVPVNAVDFTMGGPSGTILVVSDDGTLHFLSYDTDETKRWPEDSPKVVYFSKVKVHETWNLGVKRVAAGSDGDDEYVYYIAWGNNKAYIIGMSAEETIKLADGEGEKPQPKEFAFDSPIDDVLIGKNGIYVLSGGKLYVINIVNGPEGLEVTDSVEMPGAHQVSLDTSEYSDYLALYDGSTVLVIRVSKGRIRDKMDYSLEGFDRVQIYVRSSAIDLTAVKGTHMVFYDVGIEGEIKFEEIGYVELPAEPVWFEGSYPYGDTTVVLWDKEGKYYQLAAKLETGQITETQESGETGTGESGYESESSEESSSKASSSIENSLKDFLENAYTVEGLVYTKDGYNYRGIKITPKTGKLYYFPYGYEDVVFLVHEDKVLSIVPWDSDFFDGKTDSPVINPYDQGKIDLTLLPAKAKLYYSIPNGDYAAMVDENGMLHILMGLERHSENDIDWYTFNSNVVYDFDASGITIQYFWSSYLFFAWKDNELRIYIYDSDSAYKMWNEGANITVEPRVYELPGKVREVNPYIGDQFIVVLTDEGTYVIPNPLGYYGEDTNVYQIDDRVEFIGAYHYWYLSELVAYSNDQLYGLKVEYSESQRTVGVNKGPYVAVSDVVGLYGAYDQDSYLSVSTSSGTLMVYQHAWNDQTQSYEFALRKTFYLLAPLVSFTFDYRPEWDWTKVLGLGADGSFYNFEIQGPGEG